MNTAGRTWGSASLIGKPRIPAVPCTEDSATKVSVGECWTRVTARLSFPRQFPVEDRWLPPPVSRTDHNTRQDTPRNDCWACRTPGCTQRLRALVNAARRCRVNSDIPRGPDLQSFEREASAAHFGKRVWEAIRTNCTERSAELAFVS